MPRFFVPAVDGELVEITGNDAAHIGYSLRMPVGEGLTLCCNGTDYDCVIEAVTKDKVVCRVLSASASRCEPNIGLTLYQALPKSDKAELIIQKAVELGAVRIVPVLTKRCVSRPDAKSLEKKYIRWQRIAEEAAKQCGRGIIPEVGRLLDLSSCLDSLAKNDLGLMCYERGGMNLRDVGLHENMSVGLLIGSEGGFEEAEAELAEKHGVRLVGLGSRILRCETAPLAAISIIMSLTGNM